jgi:uncharacterized phage protein (TIGR02218 family)
VKTGISVALQAHYAQETTSLCRLLRVASVIKPAVIFGLTDFDDDIEYAGLSYKTLNGIDVSAISTTSGMNVDNLEVKGVLRSLGINAADIEAGVWDAATVQLLEVNYLDLTMGHNILRHGQVGQVQRNGQQYTKELRGLMQYLQNQIGRIVTANCDADFGDTRCGFNKETLRLAGTVATVTSNRILAGNAFTPEDTYGIGVLRWETGANAGLLMEVKSLEAGLYTLHLDMPYTVAVDDTFTIVPGCNKVGRLGHCKLVYNNYNRFRGFEDVPGQNQILKVGGQ